MSEWVKCPYCGIDYDEPEDGRCPHCGDDDDERDPEQQ